MSQEYWDADFSGSHHFFDPVTLTPGSSRFSKDTAGRSFVEKMLACRFVLATFRRAQNQTYLLAMPSSAAFDEQLVFKYMRRWDSPGTSQGSMYILGVPFPNFDVSRVMRHRIFAQFNVSRVVGHLLMALSRSAMLTRRSSR
jgi:hypothetical protein